MQPSFLFQLILVSVLAHVTLVGARFTTSLYALSMQASEATVGLLIALFSVFPMLFAIRAGRLVDRIGSGRLLPLAIASMAIGIALPGVVGGLPVLYAATIFIGTGFMVVQIAAQHAVGAMSGPEQRAVNFSRLSIGYSISGFSAPVVAGFVIDHVHHRAAYLALCGFAILALLLAASRLRHIQPAHPAADKAKGGAFELLRSEQMKPVYLVAVLLSAAWDMFIFVIPIYGTRLGLNASSIGLILGSFAVATLAVRLAMPWIASRYTEWQVLTASMILAMACYIVFPFMRQPATLMAVAAVLGLAIGSSQPNVLALLHRSAPPGRAGEAVGIRVTIGNASQVILPIAFGAVGASLGVTVIFLAMTAVIGSGVPVAWRRAFIKH